MANVQFPCTSKEVLSFTLKFIMENPQALQSAHFIIHGRVQGVAFRAFTLDVASRLGVHGGVRNLSNGQVEVIVEGTGQAIEQLVEALRIGPPHGRVDGLHTEWGEYSGAYTDFQIWY